MICSKREFVLGLGAYGVLTGCGSGQSDRKLGTKHEAVVRHYQSRYDGDLLVPEVNTDWIETRFLRTEAENITGLEVGEISVDLESNFLYFGLTQTKVLRYGVTLGADAFSWSGSGYVSHIRSWPRWTPTPRMMRENPALAKYRNGMPGGVRNPLGARALYIYQNGKDTLYRIHGTHVTWRIGQDYSSGCIRMFNQDVIELAELAKSGAVLNVA